MKYFKEPLDLRGRCAKLLVIRTSAINSYVIDWKIGKHGFVHHLTIGMKYHWTPYQPSLCHVFFESQCGSTREILKMIDFGWGTFSKQDHDCRIVGPVRWITGGSPSWFEATGGALAVFFGWREPQILWGILKDYIVKLYVYILIILIYIYIYIHTLHIILQWWDVGNWGWS